jgi:hypothetical protein
MTLLFNIFPVAYKTNSQSLFFPIDILTVPIFVYLVVKYFNNYKDKHKSIAIYEKYYMKALIVRLVCTLLTAMMYDFYYNGGDTTVYFFHILYIKPLLFENPMLFFQVVFDPQSFESQKWLCDQAFDCGIYLFDGATGNIIRFGLLLSYFCFSSFLVISTVFTVYAFLGCWNLYKVFQELYPHLEKEMAIACLFIPSMCFWGTGLMKDSLCLGALGLLVHSVYSVIFKRERILFNVLLAAFNIYLLVVIKVYIILAFAPALAVWVFARGRANIKSPFLKAIATPIFVTVGLISGVGVLTAMGSIAERYAMEEMMRTAKDTQNWLVTASKMSGGSFYTLGDIEYSALGLLKIIPKAVNVSLFRPYLWEAKKIMLFPAAIEGVFTFYLTIRLLFKSGFLNFFKMIAANPEVQFCLVFSIIFAFAVGFTSFNFGALARYKIPFMPFYYMALFILGDVQKKKEKIVVKSNAN